MPSATNSGLNNMFLRMALGSGLGGLIGGFFGPERPKKPTSLGYVSPYMEAANNAYYRFLGSMLGGLSKLGWGLPPEMKGMFSDVFSWFGMPGIGVGFGGRRPLPPIPGPLPYMPPIVPYHSYGGGGGNPKKPVNVKLGY